MLARSTVLLVLLLAPLSAVAATPDEALESLTESLAAVDCNQSGSVTSLGSHAAQGGGGGTWTVEGNNLVMVGEGAGSFPMSYSDGTFYLGNWRYFIVEFDDPTCQ